MKKIKFFSSGSKNERHFLNQMLDQNYALTNKKFFTYHFKYNQNNKQKKLLVEYLDEDTFNSYQELAESTIEQATINHKLFLAPFYVAYTYIDSLATSLSSNELSDRTKLNYLKYRENQTLVLNIFIVLFGIFWWFIKEFFFKQYLSSTFFYQITALMVLWVITISYNHVFSKKALEMEVKLDVSSLTLNPTLTIIIKGITNKPDISKLSYLGNWRFLRESKTKAEYYFKLDSSLSREEIKQEVSHLLSIDQENISISSPHDLIGISF